MMSGSHARPGIAVTSHVDRTQDQYPTIKVTLLYRIVGTIDM